MQLLIAILVGAAFAGALAVLGARLLVRRRLAADEREREQLVFDAHREADSIRRETQVEVREQAVQLRAELEQELGDRRAGGIKIEERALGKEEENDGKLTELERQ